jgi:hypothetical protein
VRGIDETIEALLAAGEPNAVIELAEHALAAAERALEHIDYANRTLLDELRGSRWPGTARSTSSTP